MKNTKTHGLKRAAIIVGSVIGGLCLVVMLALVGIRIALTDARLTQIVTSQLNEKFMGTFEIEAVQWRLPLHVAVHNMRVLTPKGTPVAKFGNLEATVRLLPLLTGRVLIEGVELDDLRVDLMVPAGQGQPPLAVALAPTDPSPPKPKKDMKLPLRIELADVTIRRADIFAKAANMRARLKDVRIPDGEVWAEGDSLGATLDLRGLGSVHVADKAADEGEDSKDVDISSPFHVKLVQATYRFATDTPAAAAVERLLVELPGVELDAHGKAQMGEKTLASVALAGKLHFNTEQKDLRNQFPDEARDGLRGTGTAHFSLNGADNKHRFAMDLDESRLEVRGIPVKGMHLAGDFKAPRLTVDAFKMTLATGTLEVQGNVELPLTKEITAGAHTFDVTARALPVRMIAGQAVKFPKLLPKAVSFDIRSSGRALWPPTSEVDVDIHPEGLPLDSWPGFPETIALRGKLLTHPDIVEIMRLEVSGKNVPHFAIRGSLPMREQSILDLLNEIHEHDPKGPLQRIPGANEPS